VDLAAKEALKLDEFETFMDTAQPAEIGPIEKGIEPEAVSLPGDELAHEEAPPEVSFEEAPPEVSFEEAAPPPALQEEPPALGVPETYETTFEGSDLGSIESAEAPPLIEELPPPPPPVQAEVKTGGPPTDIGSVPDEAVRAIIRETVERVVWEIVPELAETLIQEEIKKLKSKQ